jgi:hypothetical protein
MRQPLSAGRPGHYTAFEPKARANQGGMDRRASAAYLNRQRLLQIEFQPARNTAWQKT